MIYLILLLAAIIRLVKIDILPGEIYGDIILMIEWTKTILNGQALPAFFLSNGPLYFYPLALFVKFFGLTYLNLKIFSIFISLLTIFFVYLTGKKLFDKRFGLIAAFLLASSKWHIIFSRLAVSQIIVPLLVILTIYFLINYLKKTKNIYLFLACFFSSLNFYVYAAMFIFPFVILMIVVNLVMKKRAIRSILFLLIIFSILSFPLFNRVLNQSFFKNDNYISEKIVNSDNDYLNRFIYIFPINLTKFAMSFNFKGDSIFRNNPPNQPQLDFITGIFFILGFALLFINQRRYFFLAITIIFSLVLPSLLVLNYPEQNPSAIRTLSIVPIVMMIAAYSLSKIDFPNKIIILFLGIILVLNVKSYFIDYQNSLPNHNVAFGREIATIIDKIDLKYSVFVFNCCWGEWSQPESMGIQYALQKSRFINFVSTAFICNKKQAQFIVFGPNDKNIENQINQCFNNQAQIQTLEKNNEKIAKYLIYNGIK